MYIEMLRQYFRNLPQLLLSHLFHSCFHFPRFCHHCILLGINCCSVQTFRSLICIVKYRVHTLSTNPNCLSVFDHFVGLALKVLINKNYSGPLEGCNSVPFFLRSNISPHSCSKLLYLCNFLTSTVRSTSFFLLLAL